MTTLENIRAKMHDARKNNPEMTSFWAFVLSECEAVGKNKHNGISTEDEVQAKLSSLVKRTKESLETDSNSEKLKSELSALEELRPQMVSKDELFGFINTQCRGLPIGAAMSAIKKQYGNAVDMSLASSLVRAQI